MTKGRDISAESIGSLLEVVHAQQWSGMLRAERSQGDYLEEGEIYMLFGQPIYARTGMLIGHEALKRLLGWRKVHFAFETNAPRPRANLTPTSYSRNTGELGMAVRFPAPVQMPVLAPHSPPKTDELRWNTAAGRGSFAPSSSSMPGVERLVPQKVGSNRDALAFSLSRRQRHIYFMVDGRRTVSDLARCTNKTVVEVEMILSELREQDMVTI